MIKTSHLNSRFGRFTILLACCIASLVLLYASRPYLPDPVQRQLPSLPDIQHHTPRPIPINTPPTIYGSNTECRGPRGGRPDGLSEDVVHPVVNLGDNDEDYPIPTYGSYDAIGLEKTWMTFEQRYGPYGYEGGENSTYASLNWDDVSWGRLQDQCLMSKAERRAQKGERFLQHGAAPKFRLVHEAPLEFQVRDDVGGEEEEKTGRHAIVLRTWEGYDYKDEDYWNLRSIITEAGLAMQGDFTVILLVDVKRSDGAQIHEDDDFYREVLEEAVPKEFQDIAVLFHKSLQQSWYPKVNEYEPFWQIMQPLQLFAHFYRDFDTYWQVEMDTRFTGHVGEIAKSLHKFGEAQPYKQSRERASWTYLPRVHGTYEDFSAGINKSLDGGATVWGAIDNGVFGWNPAGETPPTKPTEDDFSYGVGQDADLLLFSPVSDILRIQTDADWPFTKWHAGVSSSTPRFLSFPAQAWASRTLLEAIHRDQHRFGLRVHSEATLPTFALWHGLKVVQAPMPKFQWPERDVEELDLLYNGGKTNREGHVEHGGSTNRFDDGIANGPAPYRSGAIRFFARPRTFEWVSSLNDPLWERWRDGVSDEANEADEHEGADDEDGKRLVKRARSNVAPIPEGLPEFMRMVDGRVYMPPFMMHPRKTNRNH